MTEYRPERSVRIAAVACTVFISGFLALTVATGALGYSVLHGHRSPASIAAMATICAISAVLVAALLACLVWCRFAWSVLVVDDSGVTHRAWRCSRSLRWGEIAAAPVALAQGPTIRLEAHDGRRLLVRASMYGDSLDLVQRLEGRLQAVREGERHAYATGLEVRPFRSMVWGLWLMALIAAASLMMTRLDPVSRWCGIGMAVLCAAMGLLLWSRVSRRQMVWADRIEQTGFVSRRAVRFGDLRRIVLIRLGIGEGAILETAEAKLQLDGATAGYVALLEHVARHAPQTEVVDRTQSATGAGTRFYYERIFGLSQAEAAAPTPDAQRRRLIWPFATLLTVGALAWDLTVMSYAELHKCTAFEAHAKRCQGCVTRHEMDHGREHAVLPFETGHGQPHVAYHRLDVDTAAWAVGTVHEVLFDGRQGGTWKFSEDLRSREPVLRLRVWVGLAFSVVGWLGAILLAVRLRRRPTTWRPGEPAQT